MPDAKDDRFVPLRRIRVTQDICGAAKWNDQFAGSRSSRRTPALSGNSHRPYGSLKSTDKTSFCCRIFVLKKRSEPLYVERRSARNSQPHSLRGLGGGSSFAVPQLSIQSLTSSHGTPMRVRSNSARRLASSSSDSDDHGPSPLARILARSAGKASSLQTMSARKSRTLIPRAV